MYVQRLLSAPSTTPALATAVVEPVPVSAEPTPSEVKAAMESFRALPRKERKERVKEAKKMLKEYKADKRAGKVAETDQVLLAILAILLATTGCIPERR